MKMMTDETMVSVEEVRPPSDRGQGRNPTEGFTKPLTVRFANEDEWAQVAALTPWQRTQACLLFRPEVLVDVVRILTEAGYRLPAAFETDD